MGGRIRALGVAALAPVLVALATGGASAGVAGASPAGVGGSAAVSQVVDPFGEFTSLTPARILDTRSGVGRDGVAGPLGGGASFTVQIAGQGGVPATGVQAVVMNVTVVGPTGPSFLTVWPTGLARPEVSNLNYVPGQTVPNLVTVAVGDGGRVEVFNNVGAAHVVFDVVGFYADDTGPSGSRFKGLSPVRLFDTRYGAGGVPAAPVASGGTLRFQVTGVGGVPATGVTGLVMNVTATGTTAPGFVTVYPDDVPLPFASNLNFAPGQTVPNLVTVRVPANGTIDFFNALGTTHLFADVVGYYTTGVTTEEGRFVALPPDRALDTRPSGWPMGPDEVWGLPVAGFGYVPATGASAVVTNVTATQPTAPGWLTVYPNDSCLPPLASNLNFVPGQTVPNLVITRLATVGGCDWEYPGSMLFHNAVGETHVLVDVFGVFTDDSVASAAASSLAPLDADGGPSRRPSPKAGASTPVRVGRSATME